MSRSRAADLFTRRIVSKLVKMLMFLIFAIVFVGVVALLVFGLWNYLMPGVFGLPKIGYWQAVAMLVLSRILFGRFAGPGGRWGRRRFATGWNDLTPEERARFRQAMGDRFPEKPAAQ